MLHSNGNCLAAPSAAAGLHVSAGNSSCVAAAAAAAATAAASHLKISVNDTVLMAVIN